VALARVEDILVPPFGQSVRADGDSNPIYGPEKPYDSFMTAQDSNYSVSFRNSITTSSLTSGRRLAIRR
jgi:hypothetical protein